MNWQVLVAVIRGAGDRTHSNRGTLSACLRLLAKCAAFVGMVVIVLLRSPTSSLSSLRIRGTVGRSLLFRNYESFRDSIFDLSRLKRCTRHSGYALLARRSASSEVSWEQAADGTTLVIVESPAKARTIEKFLLEQKGAAEGGGTKYVVDSCMGHIRSLAQKKSELPEKCKLQLVVPQLSITVADLSVDIKKNFTPLYVDLADKKPVIKRLKSLAKGADRILLATDEDREGEAISWHLLQVLKPKVPYKRAVFHEITESAIFESFQKPRDIDMSLVQAQETRKILDRLVGFTLSPLLWRFIAPGISAGRVQSCGLNAIAQREKRRWQFKPSNYHAISAMFGPTNASSSKGPEAYMEARLFTLNHMRVATERDFDGDTGELKGDGARANERNTSNEKVVEESSPAVDVSKPQKQAPNILVLDDVLAERTMAWLNGSAGMRRPYFNISDIEQRRGSRKPPLPFITSSLQQESSNKLGMSPARTMRIAQNLYESGYITYMRTDSPTLAASAQDASRQLVKDFFGNEYLEEGGAEKSKTKPKNAQEAHEAIRPAVVDGKFRLPAVVVLDKDQQRLYDLIFRRTLASQMRPSRSVTYTYTIAATSPEEEQETSPGCEIEEMLPTQATFRYSNTRSTFSGFLAAYHADAFGGSFRKSKALKGVSSQKDGATGLSLGEAVEIVSDVDSFGKIEDVEGVVGGIDEIDAVEDGNDGEDVPDTPRTGVWSTAKTTRPPSRFTEAGFIRELEELGVGRPSTYARICQILKEREYINVERKTIFPTIKGMVVNELLEKHFQQLTDPKFTAEMEKSLDMIAQGKGDKLDFLSSFYLGTKKDETNGKTDNSGLVELIMRKLENDEINQNESRVLRVPFLEDLGRIQYGKWGAIFELSQDNTTIDASSLSDTGQARKCSWSLPEAMLVDCRGLTRPAVENIINEEIPVGGKYLGDDPVSKKSVYLKSGRYGKYIQLGEDTEKKGDKTFFSLVKGISSEWLNLERALEFINLPLVLGDHPSMSNASMIVEVASGDLAVGVDAYPFRVALDESIKLPSEVTADLAADLLSDVNAIRASNMELGEYDGEIVTIRKGRFGYFMKMGSTMRSLPKGREPTSISLGEAVELLLKKAARDALKGRKKTKAAPKKRTPKAKSSAGSKTKAKASTKMKTKAAAKTKVKVATKAKTRAAAVKTKDEAAAKAKPKAVAVTKSRAMTKTKTAVKTKTKAAAKTKTKAMSKEASAEESNVKVSNTSSKGKATTVAKKSRSKGAVVEKV